MVYDAVIIGGGTAGLTAALYLKREYKSVMLIEKEGFGGQILYAPKVENYPGFLSVSGADFIDRLLSQAEALGAEYTLETVLNVQRQDGFVTQTDSGIYRSKTVILATGLTRRRLGLNGEDELVGNGVSYCAVCDGAFFKGREVAVIGGGNTALGDALHLSAYAKTVHLIHRRDAFRGEQATLNRLRTVENIVFHLGCTPSSFIRRSGGVLTGLSLKNVASGNVFDLALDGIFVSIGKIPQNDAYRSLVSLDTEGYILAGEDTRTTCPGVFAAGDCRQKRFRQLTTAAADGTAAALCALEYLD